MPFSDPKYLIVSCELTTLHRFQAVLPLPELGYLYGVHGAEERTNQFLVAQNVRCKLYQPNATVACTH